MCPHSVAVEEYLPSFLHTTFLKPFLSSSLSSINHDHHLHSSSFSPLRKILTVNHYLRSPDFQHQVCLSEFRCFFLFFFFSFFFVLRLLTQTYWAQVCSGSMPPLSSQHSDRDFLLPLSKWVSGITNTKRTRRGKSVSLPGVTEGSSPSWEEIVCGGHGGDMGLPSLIK